jgi:ubiquinone biosynthesis protein Coq4
MRTPIKKQLKKARERLLVFLAHDIALPYFRIVRKGYNFPYTLASLQQLPEGSVGNTLYTFFDTNGLSLLPHYEKHDIKHVVLGYPATDTGEVSLQCFMLANGRITLPVLFCVLVGITIMPEYWSTFRQAWNKGRRTPSLNRLDWFSLVPQQLHTVQNQIFNNFKK